MRSSFILLAAVLLVTSFAAGPALAIEDDSEYKWDDPDKESDPDCHGKASDSGVTLDLEDISGGAIPVRQPIPFNFDFDEDGNKDLVLCSGEHWDSQDPNTRDSSSDTRVDQDKQNEEGEQKDVMVYVNPLGDCSKYKNQAPEHDCSGGVERPEFYVFRDGESDAVPVDLRVTAAANYTGDPDATTYHNLEIWSLGVGSTSVKADTGDQEGWVALYLEDHSDDTFGDDGELSALGFGDPIDFGDGNYLTIPFTPIFAADAGEGDCTQSHYEDDPSTCHRDNTAVTVQFGYDWLQLGNHVDTPETGHPSPLP